MLALHKINFNLTKGSGEVISIGKRKFVRKPEQIRFIFNTLTVFEKKQFSNNKK